MVFVLPNFVPLLPTSPSDPLLPRSDIGLETCFIFSLSLHHLPLSPPFPLLALYHLSLHTTALKKHSTCTTPYPYPIDNSMYQPCYFCSVVSHPYPTKFLLIPLVLNRILPPLFAWAIYPPLWGNSTWITLPFRALLWQHHPLSMTHPRR